MTPRIPAAARYRPPMAERPAPPPATLPDSTHPTDPGDRPAPDPAVGPRPHVDRRVALLTMVSRCCRCCGRGDLRAGRHYVPLGDEATIDLRVRDVFTSNTPLVGVYSRGFNHPGPLLFWLLAPLSVLSGGAAWATLVWCRGPARSSRSPRRDGWPSGAGAAALARCARRAGRRVLLVRTGRPVPPAVEPDDRLPVLHAVPAPDLVGRARGRWQVLGAGITATLLVQFHVGYLPLVVVAAVWARVVVVLLASPPAGGARRSSAAPRWRPVAGWTAAALVVLWSPVVVDQLTRTPGNLGAVHLLPPRRRQRRALGRRRRVRLRVPRPAPVARRRRRVRLPDQPRAPGEHRWLLVAAAILLVGFVAAHRSGRRVDRLMLQLATVTASTSVVAISRVTVELAEFLFYWRVISAVFVVLAAWWAVAGWLRIEQDARVRWIPIVALTVVMALFFAVRPRRRDRRQRRLQPHRRQRGPTDRRSPRRRCARPTRPDPRPGRDDLRPRAPALFDDLDRSGTPVRVDGRNYGYEYGAHRTADVDDVSQIWYVGAAGSRLDILEQHPGGRLGSRR